MERLRDGVSTHTLCLLVIEPLLDQRHLCLEDKLHLLDQQLQRVMEKEEERGQNREAV